ncbi:MAG: MBL fold metallo-hydrolase [Candidatus Marinimicrobia bacterium]|jgi:glyoxylase-like metal-dependent hydrolase (beta-lactamase superfamily II)|nr:MBL fold metallo-hydrolase [Candidatus Neomarinimicrobiota bacterium]MBT3691762.1 MBL fold metallo-hydrolase [Candidatus Neomarinimicrobiota bacterium]MBT4144282.1 MBL fold metallo-hydrolase [Candidatus Neomarinimicrobiota bacterium]MBT4990720.1 MBL fold metallo-hydrolase [Candidatus Neomarinimicrobiota bacterium]MBT5356539.1 MBL fold metallo-hydrolase [Candidatus Neomarinimicrobiota bacterium]
MLKIGQFECHSIETSEFGLDGGAMFGIIPKPLWEKKIPADSQNRIPMVTRSLLLISDNKKILVDTGNGTKWSEKLKHIYNIKTDRYNMESGLGNLGISSNEITDVICTHLHFDHIGGNTKWEDGKIVPTFPNAKYWMPKENLDLAKHPSQKDQGSFMEQDWKVLEENGMIQIVDGTSPFLEGIDFILTHGHTKGMLHPIISDGTQTLFYGADIIPSSAHIPIPWIMAYDIDPVLTVDEKAKLLPKMLDENWIIFFEHDQKVQAGTLKQEGKHFSLDKEIVISG